MAMLFLFIGEETLVLQRSNENQKKAKEPKQADQLNMRGVYLHVLGDALGSVIVIINALIIKYASGSWTMYIDPVMSMLMVIIILKTSIPLLKESSMILMQTVPTHLKIKEIQEKLVGQIDGVLSIHEFHIWQLSGNKIIGELFFCCFFKTVPPCLLNALYIPSPSKLFRFLIESRKHFNELNVS